VAARVAWQAKGMRLAVFIEPQFGASYADQLRVAQHAEELGFEAFFRSDHFLTMDSGSGLPGPTESWATLAALAVQTSRIRLGTMLTSATFRLPGVLAMTVAQVDEMSGGRIELGLGAGWFEAEHRAYGIPFPPVRERFDRLEEQLAVITGLWRTPTGDEQGFSFTGKHYTVEENRTPPRPAQTPHPPIIIGGSGPKRTPAIAARYATEFNGALGGNLRERYAIFHRACEAIGRDPSEPRLSFVLPVACGTTTGEAERRGTVMGSERIRANASIGTPQQIVDRIGELREAGADTVYFHIYDINDLDHIALLGAEVLPQVTDSALVQS
jgi:F420-dependent oxidoreductase-like protein